MDYFLENYSEFSSADHANFSNNNCNNAHFTVDDLLDFSNNDETMTDSFLDSLGGNSGNSSVVTAVESCNSSVSGGGDAGQCNGDVSFRGVSESSLFTGSELCVPYDDLAELEWLSTFAEESFSTNDLRFIPTTATGICKITDTSSSITTTHSPPPPPPLRVPSEVSVPGKARSRRPRAAPCDWSSRLLPVTPKPEPVASKKRVPSVETSGRKCLHCASEKTPQWRTGPMGPKTLCNACGVRFKSGRLVPEYRPAASPTFVSARHSNSHRKVMELRRQKEQQQQQMLGHGSIFDGGDEFLIQRQQCCYRNEINCPDLGGHII